MGPGSLEVRVLGSLEVVVDGRRIEVPSGRQRPLLAILALHAPDAVSTDELIELLWPEEQPANAAGALQVLVSRLRASLGSGAAGGGRRIVTRGAGYALDVDPEAIDARRLVRIVASAREAREAADHERAIERYADALSLVRGAPLADFQQAQFAQGEIARLEETRLAAIEERIESALALGRSAEVLGEIRSLVERHPLRERLRGALMLALYRTGRQAEALDAYRDAREVLVRELGIEPGPELRELERAVLRQSHDLDTPGTGRSSLPAALDGLRPLAGRAVELAALADAWRATTRGATRVAMLDGDAGIGKSLLAATIGARSHERGATVLHVSCSRDARGGVRAGLKASGLLEPAEQASLLAAAQDSDPPVLQLLDAMAGRSPLVLILDDLGWAAPPTLALVDELAGGSRRILVVGTLSERDLGPDDPVTARLRAWRERAGVTRIYVDSLADDDLYALVAAEAPSAPAALLRSVVLAAEGNPSRALDGLWASAGRAPADAGRSSPCPYKGLAAFDVSDSDLFCGREELVLALSNRLGSSRALAIVGPSGSGKSSLLRAGLLAQIMPGGRPGEARWRVALLRPGPHPLAELASRVAVETGGDAQLLLRGLESAPEALDLAARQVAARHRGDRLLVAVDQFEEAFTQCGEPERSRFVAALVHASAVEGGSTTLALTLRADFYGRCAELPGLAAVVTADQTLLAPLDAATLRTMVEEPARRTGLRLEPGLAETIVDDVVGQPSALPLLGHALVQTWHERRGATLTLDGYRASGGVRGALVRSAEAAYHELSAAERDLLRRVLLRLVEPGDGTHDTARRVALAELEPAGSGDSVGTVLERFVAARLVTLDAGTVELSHEALLHAWPRLRGWIDADRDALLIQRHLRSAARAWFDLDRDPGELYRGVRLAAVREWAERGGVELAPLEREFLEESIATQAEASRLALESVRRQTRQNRRLRLALAVATLLVLVVAAALVVANRSRNQAESRQRAALSAGRVAESRRLAAQASQLDAATPDLALLLAVEGSDLGQSRETRDALLTTLGAHPGVLGFTPERGGVLDLAASPDGLTVAAADEVDGVDLLRAGRPAAPRRLPGTDSGAVAYLPDGSLVTTSDPAGLYRIVRLDPATGRTLMRTAAVPAGTGTYAVAASADGRLVAGGSDDGTVRVYAAATGRETARFRVRGASWSVAFSRDGTDLAAASADGPATVFELASGRRRLLAPVQEGTLSVAWSATGALAVGGDDGAVALFRGDGTLVHRPTPVLQGSLLALAFTRDGRRLIAAGEDGTVRSLDAFTLAPRAPAVTVATGPVLSLAPSRDGTTVAAGTENGHVVTVALDGQSLLARFLPGGRLVTGVAAAGRTAVTTGLDGRVRRFAIAGGGEIGGSTRLGAPGGVVAITRDGSLIAAARADGAIVLIEASSGAIRATLSRRRGEIEGLAFSPDGTRLASASRNGAAILWDVGTSSPTAIRLAHRGSAWPAAVAFSPDGARLAVGDETGDLDLFDGRSGAARGVPYGQNRGIRSLAFSADGRLLAVGGTSGSLRLVDARRWVPTGDSFDGHTGDVVGLAFSADARTLYSTSHDGTLRLWQVDGALPIGPPLPTGSADTSGLALVAGGGQVLAEAGDGARLWDVDPATWPVRACRAAGRNLTAREWARYGPAGTRRATCRAYPLAS